MAGIEEDELINKSMGFDFGIVKIPIEKLIVFGTSCGVVGNKAFNAKIIDFLKSLNVKFILGLSENKKFTILSAAIPIIEKEGLKFEKMIDKNKGILRCDNSNVKGWTIYESE